MEFNKLGILNKIFFKITILTICTIIANIYLVSIFTLDKFSEDQYKIPIILNLIVLLFLGRLMLKHHKIKLQTLWVVGIFALVVFVFIDVFLSIDFNKQYIGLRKVDSTGYVVDDSYCFKNCEEVKIMLHNDYYIDRKFYSWKEAEILGRNSLDNSYCYLQPFDNKFLFGFLLILEMTFEYLPLIFFISILFSVIEYIRKKDFRFLSLDFIDENDFDILKINRLGIIILIIIISYNALYIHSLNLVE